MSAIPLPSEWIEYVRQQPETGMVYHVVLVILLDGRKFDQVAVRGRLIVQVHGFQVI